MRIKLNSQWQQRELLHAFNSIRLDPSTVKATVADIPDERVEDVRLALETRRNRELECRLPGYRGRLNAIGSVRRAIDGAREVLS